MKKLIFAGLVILLAFALVTCGFTPNALGVDKEEIEYTNVVYSADGRSLTLYLDEGVPVTAAARALDREMAMLAHNLFEVVFMYDADGTAGGEKIARTSWVRGDAAGISGVERVGTTPAVGVNYAATSLTYGSGQTAAAVLFVGRRSDNTLLGMGRVFETNDGTGFVPGTIVSTTTRAVKFQIVALSAGASFDPAESSFKTANGETNNAFLSGQVPGTTGPSQYISVTDANTEIGTVNLSGTNFPVFTLDTTRAMNNAPTPIIHIAAEYEFLTTEDFVSGSPDPAYRMSAFLDSIIPHATAPSSEVSSPQFYSEGKLYFIDMPNEQFSIARIVTTERDTARVNVVRFKFDITGMTTSGYASFMFRSPVYAMTADPGASVPPTPALVWYLRPAYGSNIYDLDNGLRNYGGSILLGLGNLDYLQIVATSPK